MPPSGPDPGAEIDEEFAFHLDSAERDGREAGLVEGDARAEARAAFGDVSTHRDACIRVANGSTMMTKRLMIAAGALVVLVVGYVAGLATTEIAHQIDRLSAPDWERIGAFEGLVWQDQTPVVLLENRWYVLETVNGRSVESILLETTDEFGAQTRMRFSEDMYEILLALGEPGDRIDVELRDPATGEVSEVQALELTHEKRQSTKWQEWKQQEGVPPVPAVWLMSLEESELIEIFGC